MNEIPKQVNGYNIKTEADVWQLPKLTTRAKINLVEILRKQGAFVEDNIKKETKTKPLAPTFEEMASGKSIVEILAERKRRLEKEWKRRERESFLRGYQK